jgi:hypothetical protein
MLSKKLNQEQKKKPFRRYYWKPEEEKGVPLLRCGKGNNFYKFRAALSDLVTEKYGNLGKLIDLEELYLLQLVFTDFDGQGYSQVQIKHLELEEFKELIRHLPR